MLGAFGMFCAPRAPSIVSPCAYANNASHFNSPGDRETNEVISLHMHIIMDRITYYYRSFQGSIFSITIHLPLPSSRSAMHLAFYE